MKEKKIIQLIIKSMKESTSFNDTQIDFQFVNLLPSCGVFCRILNSLGMLFDRLFNFRLQDS